jgi:hypothetical protein
LIDTIAMKFFGLFDPWGAYGVTVGLTRIATLERFIALIHFAIAAALHKSNPGNLYVLRRRTYS